MTYAEALAWLSLHGYRQSLDDSDDFISFTDDPPGLEGYYYCKTEEDVIRLVTKLKEEKQMTQQKPYYEFDNPRKRYGVRLIEITDECCCLQEEEIISQEGVTLDKRTCYETEGDFYRCECCGIPTCEMCIVEELPETKTQSQVLLQHYALCGICVNLPVSIREQVATFRRNLNR